MPKTATLEGGIKQGTNDFGNTGYGGPCPPRGHGRHRYYFILKALDVPTLGLTPAKSKRELEKAMKGHVLGEARITGVFER
jgi:Raf kinase inhibitor-like YbhB/YbcL family protein